MRKTAAPWLMLSILAWPFGAFASESGTGPIVLDMREAIRLALDNNLTIHNAYLGRIADRFDYRVAYDDYGPQWSLGASAVSDSIYSDEERTRYDDVDASLSLSKLNRIGGQLALTASQSGSYAEDSDEAYDSALSLSYTQPLLQGAGTVVGSAALTYADWSEQSSLLGLESTLIGVIDSVIGAYRSYFLAQQSLRLTKLSLERAERQVEINRELIEAGRLPALDLVQSRADLANQRLSVRSAENSVDAARVTLVRLLRLPEAAELELTEPVAIAPLTLTLEEALATAFTHRQDYRLAEISLASARLGEVLARDEQRWELDLSVDYYLAGSDTRFNRALRGLERVEQGDYAVGLDLSIPLGDLSREQTLVSAQVSLAQARNAMVDTKESIRLELIDALRDIAIRWDEIHLAEQSLELTRQQFELEQEKLATGRSSSFQVITYQNQLLSAENRYLTAKIDYLNALTDLDSSLGTTLRSWGVERLPQEALTVDAIPRFEQTTALGAGE